MSISLVVLRLELADEYDCPDDFEFCALDFKIKKKMSSAGTPKNEEISQSSSAESSPRSTEEETKTNKSEAFNPKDIKLNQGQRELGELSIETLKRESEATNNDGDKEDTEDRVTKADETSQWMGRIGFFSGNPTVETVKGILHIYKSNEMTSLTKGISRSQTICMLAVPAKLACIDLLQFVAPSEEFIQHIKIIRDATPNQYMALIKFKNQELADEFYNTYNGHQYNSLEEEVCHLVYVAKVEVLKSSQGASLPCSGLTELPKCPVCLERMDESVEGVLTILCNHSFHGSCLSKWSDTSCPVCRYVQTPEPTSENRCLTCDSTENLWICLICGHVGCGRYAGCHAYRHYEKTQHTYSLELGTQRVWDYTGDNYVHRLIQNKTDGKLVEYGPAQGQYTYLLTNQLENQRMYFQEKITRVETEAAEQVKEMEERSKKTLEEVQRLEKKLADSEKEKKNLEKKYTQVVSKVGKLVSELKEEKELNQCLRDNQKLWNEKVSQVEKKLEETETKYKTEVSDLQEQVNDLMRHFETQQAIACAPDDTRQELQEGQLLVGESQTQQPKSRRKRR
ncbi:BRCA1-associated protein-like isoform X2 [Actinia tenebrosa]|uniref:BRCA1-associated protein-like isoform X2 n=1 Tax=Actinia tenebrosa TaxID=6105 RepID=A0A6P8IUS0_ACTTE|nr:BRCA1-associated protein-like isoform X2 [Actinia tenebrosa]